MRWHGRKNNDLCVGLSLGRNALAFVSASVLEAGCSVVDPAAGIANAAVDK